LTPPGATDITLKQDLLDHYTTYTVSEKELNAFLDKRFARPGKAFDSFSERSPADPNRVGNEVGPLGFVVTEDTVKYSYSARNGGGTLIITIRKPDVLVYRRNRVAHFASSV
jgi:hypothetical protein